MPYRILLCAWAAVLAATPVAAQAPEPARRAALAFLEEHRDRWAALSRQIWEFAETQFQETRSAQLLKDELRRHGFRVEDSAAGMATAFIATYGSGAPVIDIMAEYDALPGLSQQATAERKPLVEGGNGHGCGHNLFGTASVAAAIAVKQVMEERKLPGTLRVTGTPAEEGGGGKIFLIRAGAFRNVDVSLVWHPWDRNQADNQPWLSNISAKFRFQGRAAHAAASPDAGRSALDAVEVMTHAVNLLREHVPQETRLHYVITKGGSAANIVPDLAELSLIARHPEQRALEGIWERVLNCAQAGALASGTRMEFEVTSSYANYLPNDTLLALLDRNLKLAGGVEYTAGEREFVNRIRATLGAEPPPLEEAARIHPPKTDLLSASTDVGDVSWTIPTGQFFAATFPPGVPLHTWQSTAVAGTSAGQKGMLVAARTLALSALELLYNPALAAQAKASFEQSKAGRAYRSLLPEGRQPVAR